jgi:hypothetical protein
MAECDDAPRRIELSWSRLKAYEVCHQRGKLMLEGKKSKAIDGRVFLAGNLADRAMMKWLNEGKKTGDFRPGGMEALIPELWREQTGPEGEYSYQWKGDPREDKLGILQKAINGLRILEPILMEKVVPYEFRTDYRFKAPVGIPGLDGETVNIELSAAVDVAVQISDQQYGLYDLKLSDKAGYLRSTLGQLIFYDLVFKAYTGLQAVEHEFWAPLLPIADKPESAIIALDVQPEHRKQMVSRIIAYSHGVWSGSWELTPDENECYFCPVKHACPRWLPSLTKDDQGRNRAAFGRNGASYGIMDKKEKE